MFLLFIDETGEQETSGKTYAQQSQEADAMELELTTTAAEIGRSYFLVQDYTTRCHLNSNSSDALIKGH